MTEKEYEKIKKEFDKYYENYKGISTDVSLKYNHCYSVANLMVRLAKELNLGKDKIYLAKTIGLLHDLGRFEQLKRENSYDDKKFDHAKYACDYLFEEEHIKDFIETRKYDDLIHDAILYHNKYDYPIGLDEEDALFIKMIRDTDKIDIYFVTATYFDYFFDGKISEIVLKEFESESLVLKEDLKYPSDEVVFMMSYLNDINFKESYELLEETENFSLWLSNIEVWPNGESKFKELNNKCSKIIEGGIKNA